MAAISSGGRVGDVSETCKTVNTAVQVFLKHTPFASSGLMPGNTHLCSDELLGLGLAGVRELLSEAQVHCVPRLGTGALPVVLELCQKKQGSV